MIHQALDPRFHTLIDGNARFRTLGSGFEFTEGPVWHPKEHFLQFSDIPGNARYRWDRDGVKVAVEPSNKGNGMTYDRQLRLLVCEHATSTVSRFSHGHREVLASHFEGQELNSPNDIIVGKDGAIYFSDPTYGRMPRFGVERSCALGFQGVYRIAPGGGATELLVEKDLFTQPNGLCFSPDEKLLYVNDTKQTNIRVFDVKDGALHNMRIFASGIVDSAVRGHPDGMKCDANGNVWVTAPAGLWIYAPGGELIGKIAVPEFAANFNWGGPDWRTLFVTASSSLYAVDVKVGPHLESFMTID